MSEEAYAYSFFLAHGHARDEDPPLPDEEQERPEDEAEELIPPPL